MENESLAKNDNGSFYKSWMIALLKKDVNEPFCKKDNA